MPARPSAELDGGREERQSFKVEQRPNGFPAAAEVPPVFLPGISAVRPTRD